MVDNTTEEMIIETDLILPEGVGPIIRAGEVADAVIGAIALDNPGKKVYVVDRGDYLRINTLNECVLTQVSLEQCLGREMSLARLEIEMPSFAGRIKTTDKSYTWYHNH